ncbi:MAG: hypothetical protein IT291_06865 [Deltaproteobacteria bacterium]|nr:hypothetical protein [Deltaproteobacteria bacterium]
MNAIKNTNGDVANNGKKLALKFLGVLCIVVALIAVSIVCINKPLEIEAFKISGVLLGIAFGGLNLLSWSKVTGVILGGKRELSFFKRAVVFLMVFFKLPLVILVLFWLIAFVQDLVISFLIGYVSLLFLGAVVVCLGAKREETDCQ